MADTYNNRIQVFTAEGKFLRMFERHGYLSGIAIDTSDLFYISDNNIRRISVFTSDGQLMSYLSFGRKEEGRLGEFDWPYGLAVDDSGVVYVYV